LLEGDETPVDEPPEEEPYVPPVETPTEPDSAEYDYLVRYEQNEIGGYDYYLYDQNGSQRWKIEEFLRMGEVAAENEKLYQEQSARERTIIIVLAIITIILALVVTILLFKIRELYEDAETPFSPSRPPQGRTASKMGIPIRSQNGMNIGGTGGAGKPAPGGPPRRPPSAGGPIAPKPQKRPPETEEQAEQTPLTEGPRPKPSAPAGRGGQKPRQPRPVSPDPTASTEPAEKEDPKRAKRQDAAEGKPPAGRKAQNFLNEDDEFEFEFLNIDDK
jgi:hypothetical protein